MVSPFVFVAVSGSPDTGHPNAPTPGSRLEVVANLRTSEPGPGVVQWRAVVSSKVSSRRPFSRQSVGALCSSSRRGNLF